MCRINRETALAHTHTQPSTTNRGGNNLNHFVVPIIDDPRRRLYGIKIGHFRL